MKLLGTGAGILGCRAGQVLAGIAVMSLLARGLGPELQGCYGLTVTVILFTAALLNGGIGLAAVPALRRGEVGIRRMLAAQLLWIGVVGVVVLLAGRLGWELPLAEVAHAKLAWSGATALIVAGGIVALISFDVFFYDLLAGGRLLAGPAVNLVRAVAHLAVLLRLIGTGHFGLTTALAAWAGAQALAAVATALMSRGGDFPPRPATVLSIPALIGRTLRRGWLGQMSAVASQLHLRLDLFIVTAYCGAAATGIYYVAVCVAELLWLLPGALNPILVYTAANDADGPERNRLTARAVRLSLAATAVFALLLALLAEPVQGLLFGDRYRESIPALRALLAGVVAFAPGAVLAGDFIGRGRPQWNTHASMLTVVVNVACALLLVPRLGIVGAAWASSVAYAVGAGAMLRRFHSISGLRWSRILLLRSGDLRRG